MSGKHNELSRGSFLAFNAVAQQANDLDQNHPLSMRMLMFVGLAQAFFVLNIFNALLVSSLANESVDHEVSSLKVGILIAISGKPLMNLMFFSLDAGRLPRRLQPGRMERDVLRTLL